MSASVKEQILILVKTYPTFSKKHFETVCTAGINKQGEWRRIYPIPFRTLDEMKKYKKYQWVEFEVERNISDPRPESYKMKPGANINVIDHALSTGNNWQERKNALKNTPIYKNLGDIIKKAKDNKLSLCQFKPEKILELKVEEVEREWDKKILKQIENENSQGWLFEELKREIKLVRKLPYKFSYSFEDGQGKQSTLMIEDWEIGQLYWNCLKQHKNNEDRAIKDVKEKYERFIEEKDIILFLGTTRQFHGWASNPFVITGLFYPPKVLTLSSLPLFQYDIKN